MEEEWIAVCLYVGMNVCVRELGSVYDVLCFASVLPPITEDLINLLAIKFLN